MDTELAIKYLLKETTAEERLMFEDWLALSEGNREQFSAFSAEWENAAATVKQFTPDRQKAWEKIGPDISGMAVNTPRTPIRLLRTWQKVAAAVTLLFLLTVTGYFVLRNHVPEKHFIVYTTGDSLRKVTLADSSTVWLNKFSELRIPETSKRFREVYLEGEAFFRVTPDSRRLFRVHTDHTTTEVHGTSFNLKSADDGDIVNLVTGKISFYSGKRHTKTVELFPGEKAVFEPATGQIEKSVSPDMNFMAWKTGKLVFKDSPMPGVLKAMANYYGLKFDSNQHMPAGYILTASFENQPADEIIPVLELTWNVKITVKDSTLSISPY